MDYKISFEEIELLKSCIKDRKILDFYKILNNLEVIHEKENG